MLNFGGWAILCIWLYTLATQPLGCGKFCFTLVSFGCLCSCITWSRRDREQRLEVSMEQCVVSMCVCVLVCIESTPHNGTPDTDIAVKGHCYHCIYFILNSIDHVANLLQRDGNKSCHNFKLLYSLGIQNLNHRLFKTLHWYPQTINMEVLPRTYQYIKLQCPMVLVSRMNRVWSLNSSLYLCHKHLLKVPLWLCPMFQLPNNVLLKIYTHLMDKERRLLFNRFKVVSHNNK